jgi:hypothetical protein
VEAGAADYLLHIAALLLSIHAAMKSSPAHLPPAGLRWAGFRWVRKPLSSGISQGQANGTQFRTVPLWGAGQRFFFMPDGRFTNLDHAVKGHCQTNETTNTNESCAVIQKYRQLSPGNETLILEFLRSL